MCCSHATRPLVATAGRGARTGGPGFCRPQAEHNIAVLPTSCWRRVMVEWHRKFADRATDHPRAWRVPAPARGGRRTSVLVVGAGPAGVAAAVAAAQAGDRVVLAEATDHLGGQLAVSGSTTRHQQSWRAWRERACHDLRAGAVDVRLNTVIRREDTTGYDHVVIATGAAVRDRPLMTPDHMVVVDAWSVIVRPAPLSGPVLVIDREGEWSAPDAAVTLATHGHAVTLVTAAPVVGHRLAFPLQVRYQQRLAELGGQVLTCYTVVAEHQGACLVLCHGRSGAQRPLPRHLGALVIAGARTARAGLWSQVDGRPHASRAGDAVCPRTVEAAIAQGRKAAVQSVNLPRL
ncbi:FAD-dependent oxidoreductase (plasmid) [Streptomyces sp. CA-142005]|uniref:FAD-dependent oxidoreductase n=1 Tax=Streptomyces sp. CA-142005 TaxID=3240052 RepID=UPI003D8AD22F